MKKVLKVALMSGFLASAFLVGCGSDSLADIEKKLDKGGLDRSEKKELLDKREELREKLKVEKAGEAEKYANDFIEALKNNDLNKALSFNENADEKFKENVELVSKAMSSKELKFVKKESGAYGNFIAFDFTYTLDGKEISVRSVFDGEKETWRKIEFLNCGSGIDTCKKFFG
ncbi:hypothetical protein [Campylobacter helveticus]|uniref:hypothetical protein n=1 Tax=Campylobacter helveticus TaxID=28898 RepID=UPI002942205A|nr:hypothetical protein [Campylobacter helveticus]